MNKSTLAILIFLAVPSFMFAQKIRTEDFQFTMPEQKIPNSLYSSIRVIDARNDTTTVGIIQRGFLNDRVKLIPKLPLADQMSAVLSALTDGSAKAGELVLHVRQFTLAEITGSFSERGYCYVRAALFGGHDGSYRLLSKLDSVFVVKSADVTKGLLKTGSETITDLISANLLKEPVETEVYSYNEIYKIDSLEKRGFAIYQTDVYKDGVYRSFSSFRDHQPDGQVTAKIKKGKLLDVYTFNAKGSKEQVWHKDTYAVIYQGIPFISSDFIYYPLTKKDNDFYFTGKAKTANSTEVMVAGMMFGLLGSALASEVNAKFEMKIDHLNGGFIRGKEVKK
ncbi:MAG: hypothetical protein ABIO79_04220 [Ferruginibacter sp.]